MVREGARRQARMKRPAYTVAELDGGRAAEPVAEVALCAEHLAEVATALGFEAPGDVRAPSAGEVAR